jgi:peptidoglycan/xylan/chitin deacetylase (PgdA/CDA1 family)
MNATKFIRVIVALAVFVFFVYLPFARQPKPILPVVTTDSVRVIARSPEEHLSKDIRQLALELPDSLLPFCRGVHSQKEVALSFDACPTSGKNHFNKTIANILLQTRTPATVFLSGRWVEEDSAATRLLASDSLIEFGNHSFTHPHLTRMPLHKVREELERTQKIISDLTGHTPFLFRAPYGEYNDTLISTAKELGLATVQFDVESGDPDTTFTAPRLIKWVTKETRNGSIIIMHINNRGWHTAQALPAIIQFLRDKGYKLVKVSDLMKEVSAQLSRNVLARLDANPIKGISDNKD